MTEEKASVKHDSGKLRFELLDPEFEFEVVEILTHGAEKYGAMNWQNLPDARPRYYAALRRHENAWARGERIDPESGKPHLAHAACNLMFLLWLERGEA